MGFVAMPVAAVAALLVSQAPRRLAAVLALPTLWLQSLACTALPLVAAHVSDLTGVRTIVSYFTVDPLTLLLLAGMLMAHDAYLHAGLAESREKPASGVEMWRQWVSPLHQSFMVAMMIAFAQLAWQLLLLHDSTSVFIGVACTCTLFALSLALQSLMLKSVGHLMLFSTILFVYFHVTSVV
jgi:hypothetical protein